MKWNLNSIEARDGFDLGGGSVARVNIEECWWIDPRRSALIRLIGSEEAADGAAIKIWRLAQEFWKKDRGLIPKYLFDLLPHADFLLKVNLAEVRENMVYIRGSSAYLDWIHEEKEARKLGGQNSSQGRERDEKGRLLPNALSQSPHPVQQDTNSNPAESSCPPAETSCVQVSASASSSGSKNKESIGTAIAVAPRNLPVENRKKPPDPDIGRFIGTYVKAFQERYPPRGEGPPPRPDLRGKIQGQIKRYLEEVPIDRACELIQAYLQMNEKWFDTKCHDFGTFLENQNKVAIALDTGVDSNTTDWSKVFAGAS